MFNNNCAISDWKLVVIYSKHTKKHEFLSRMASVEFTIIVRSSFCQLQISRDQESISSNQEAFECYLHKKFKNQLNILH